MGYFRGLKLEIRRKLTLVRNVPVVLVVLLGRSASHLVVSVPIPLMVIVRVTFANWDDIAARMRHHIKK